jgi:hypothetical protein
LWGSLVTESCEEFLPPSCDRYCHHRLFFGNLQFVVETTFWNLFFKLFMIIHVLSGIRRRYLRFSQLLSWFYRKCRKKCEKYCFETSFNQFYFGKSYHDIIWYNFCPKITYWLLPSWLFLPAPSSWILHNVVRYFTLTILLDAISSL